MFPPRPRRPFSGPPRERNVQRARHSQRLLGDCLEGLDMSKAQFAAECDTGPKTVERWCGAGGRTTSVPHHAMKALPDEGRKFFARDLLEGTGCSVVATPSSESTPVDDFERLVTLQRETSEAIAVSLAAFADGVCTAAEAEPALKEALEARDVLNAQIARLEQVLRERVSGTSGFDAPRLKVAGGEG
ncbi:MAG: hypothetical protein AAGH15_11035 [Myxococcota bacterium]